MRLLRLQFITLMLLSATAALAETGADAWLRYARLSPDRAAQYSKLPATTVVFGNSKLLKSAASELTLGLQEMLGRKPRALTKPTTQDAFILGTIDQLHKFALKPPQPLAPDGYWIASTRVRGHNVIVITALNDRGVLYGTFALLGKIARGEPIAQLNDVQDPSAPARWVNQWDNLDGSIERGYAGRSIFFEHGHVRADLTRASQYARLLASVGINGCTVNNVNADIHVLDPEFIPELARLADAFRPYGVRLGISVNLSTPKQTGELDTFDPLDPRVADWWKRKFDELYRYIPDLGGVVVKADSEGQLGPSFYGRNAADAANVIARALKPHGGIVFYRAFVYNHHLDWRDLKADRARAAYDIFHPLDDRFADNVIIQIKYGPIDFQVREPASPLFGGLEKTSQAIELQITQEYTGQQRHTVFLAPLWKEILDFDVRVDGRNTPVKEIVAGRAFHRPTGGYAGVSNVGLSTNWLANHLAVANLYAFGRLAWNPDLTSRQIVDEWTRLTFGNDPLVVRTISAIQLASWPAYESYTGVLGLQTLTNILGAHYGPGPESQEHNGWGQWIRAEHDAVGMDRTIATGTGYIGQYSEAVQKIYEPLASTPDELVLFFHHVPYTYKLHTGKTVIQTIYDSHYDGAARVNDFVREWHSLHGHVDDQRYNAVLHQLEYQSGHAIAWRDAINDWFHRLSGIADEQNRVGNHPDRIEAESMELDGYDVVEVTPWETASGGKAVVCRATHQSCAARIKFQGSAGSYDLAIQYFDQDNGVSRYRLFVNDHLLDDWTADRTLPATAPNGDSSARRLIHIVSLKQGDEIRIEGTPDGDERAPLDYIEVTPFSSQ